jgi:hypothetical protein
MIIAFIGLYGWKFGRVARVRHSRDFPGLRLKRAEKRIPESYLVHLALAVSQCFRAMGDLFFKISFNTLLVNLRS